MDEQTLHLTLDRDVRAPGTARRKVGEWLAVHQFDGDLIEALEVIVSELVTNAVVHARSAPELTVTVESGRVRVEVFDTAAAPPVPRQTDDGRHHGGFGLRLVGAFAHRWGWEPSGSGKRVWAEALPQA